MTLAFKDFAPEITEERSFFKFQPSYEPLQDCLRRANEWIDARQPQIVTVETVVLPNIWARGEEGCEDSSLRVSGEMMSTWHQFIRVWYTQ